jgi:hypothetical protein
MRCLDDVHVAILASCLGEKIPSDRHNFAIFNQHVRDAIDPPGIDDMTAPNNNLLM